MVKMTATVQSHFPFTLHILTWRSLWATHTANATVTMTATVTALKGVISIVYKQSSEQWQRKRRNQEGPGWVEDSAMTPSTRVAREEGVKTEREVNTSSDSRCPSRQFVELQEQSQIRQCSVLHHLHMHIPDFIIISCSTLLLSSFPVCTIIHTYNTMPFCSVVSLFRCCSILLLRTCIYYLVHFL